jgi:cyclophilin family peptidyl-prolyl cis-trans isomerase
MGGSISCTDLDGQLSWDEIKSLTSGEAENDFYDKAFSIIAGKNNLITMRQLNSYCSLSQTPLALNFEPIKSLWFTPAQGCRGKSLVEIKDSVKGCKLMFLALYSKYVVDISRGMSVVEFRDFVLASACGVDENVIESTFFECTRYPEDERDPAEVDEIRADTGSFVSAVIRIANMCGLEARGESDKSLRQQLFDWLSSSATALCLPQSALDAAMAPSHLRPDAFFLPPDSFVASLQRPVVFIDISIDNESAGRVTLELNNVVTPKTAFNFKCLCTGERGLGEVTGVVLSLKGCSFHRVVAGMCVQGGDIEGSDGYGGESVYGGEFNDESFELKHDAEGVLSMGNQGPDTNTSQFFITLQASPHLDDVNCAFGKVISGMDVVRRLGNVPVDDDEKPVVKCIISDCGEVLV